MGNRIKNMSNIKVIKNEKDYQDALALIEKLMLLDPNPDSIEGEQLGILSTLIQDYEKKVISESLPSPIEAIKFRMEQENLKPSDLVPFIGSASRVSEILSGKRKLTIEMMRALEVGLGIPAKVLLKEYDGDSLSNWNNALLKEMSKRGYFNGILTKANSRELVENLFSKIGMPLQLQGMLRQSNFRSAPKSDRNALIAWAAGVLKKSKSITAPIKYKDGIVNLAFMQELAKLSTMENSPLAVRDYLLKHGIILLIEPHFPGTKLDGAVLFANKDNPIIGLTLRHDRLDNFWFTLMHELAHVALHYKNSTDIFYDELDEIKGLELGDKEREADDLAGEALVPTAKWEISPAKLIPSTMAANSLAKELGVHIAIVAGRIRHDGAKYIYLNNIIGQSKVRHNFPEIDWNN